MNTTTNTTNIENLIAKRLLLICLMFFTVCSVRLCAEDMTPAKAQAARESFIAEARKYVGYPYVYGASGPNSFDCSGYVYYVANQSLGRQMPRTAKALYNYCRIVPDKQREPGDLLFFKTTSSGSISHVGIYLGNNQFLSAISDGPNTGIVISSLNQDYWRTRYIAAGQFLTSGIRREEKPVQIAVAEKTKEESSKKDSSRNYVADFGVFGNWTLFSPSEFMFKFRGVDIQMNIRFANVTLQPGIGLNFRINSGLGLFQIPIMFSATLNENIKVYAGPVLSFGNAYLSNGTPGMEQEIQPSIFPGIIGFSFATPSIEAGPVKIQFVQDFSYTVFNKGDNSALSFIDSISSGLLFNTGVKVSYDF